jgi:hypothetical protein
MLKRKMYVAECFVSRSRPLENKNARRLLTPNTERANIADVSLVDVYRTRGRGRMVK